MSWLRNMQLSLFKEESPASLGLFRILVGLVLFAQTLWFISTDFITTDVFEPTLHFKYHYFQFLEPLSKPLMKVMMFLMLISAFLIAIGRFFKAATVFYGISFTYLWLLDKSYFNNHYYFISLIIFLLVFSNADAWGSHKKAMKRKSIPYWQIFILKFQIFSVFFIAGINKLTTYWIVDLQPMKHILEAKAAITNFEWLATDFSFAFFSWFGLLFDLSIGFLIWSRKTRKAAIIFYVVFNLVNFWVFYDIGEIGFFPFLLLACLSIFFSPEAVEKKLGWLNKKNEVKVESDKVPNQRLILIMVSAYVAMQLALPFRHLLYEDYVDWCGKGQRFAWRMKTMYKDPDMHFYISEKGSKEKKEVNVGNFLNEKQYTNLIYYPDFIPTVGKYIKEEGMRRGYKNPIVTANFEIGFMGHPKQYLVDTTQDLSRIENEPLKNSTWIIPLAK